MRYRYVYGELGMGFAKAIRKAALASLRALGVGQYRTLKDGGLVFRFTPKEALKLPFSGAMTDVIPQSLPAGDARYPLNSRLWHPDADFIEDWQALSKPKTRKRASRPVAFF